MISVFDSPSHWSPVPIWSMYSRVKRTGYPDQELLSVYRDYGVIPKSSRDDNHNVASEDLSAYQLVEVGDLVVNKMKAWQGSFAVSAFEGIVSPAYFVYKPHHQSNNRFLHYMLRSAPYMAHYNRISSGVRIGQWDLDPAQFRLTEVPLPPLDEQKAIADFLDRELAQIDALVAKQKELTQLARLKVQETLRYLTYSSSQSESLPDNWRLLKLKYICFIQSGYSFSSDEFAASGLIPVVRQSDLYVSELTTFTNEIPPSKFMIKPGDVLVSMSGDFNSVAWSGEVAGLNQRCAYLRPNPDLAVDWLSLVLPFALDRISSANVSTTISNMSTGELGNAEIPLPPIDIQLHLAQQMAILISKSEALISSCTEMIETLNERRKSLISAAVTGKIDVRKVA
jgi:type I restriction enzyme S subunit